MFPIGSRLQVATTDPKCDAIRPAKSFAPWFLTKNCLRDNEKKEIILKYFDFFEYIFILHLLNGEKRCLPYFSEQESAINAGEFLFQVCFTQHIYFVFCVRF